MIANDKNVTLYIKKLAATNRKNYKYNTRDGNI